MSLVFAALTPHNPVLIPRIGGEKTNDFAEVIDAMHALRTRAKKLELDTLLVLSPHAPRLQGTYGINLQGNYTATFAQFGDLVTEYQYKGDIELAYQTKEYLEADFPIHTYAEQQLDHGASVPLSYLIGSTTTKIIPISISERSLAEHFDFGKRLRKKSDVSSKKVGIIASTHLSHYEDGTGNLPEIDNEIISSLKKKNIKKFLELNKNKIKAAHSCGLEALATLLGCIDDFKYTPEVVTHTPLYGISHTVIHFTIE